MRVCPCPSIRLSVRPDPTTHKVYSLFLPWDMMLIVNVIGSVSRHWLNTCTVALRSEARQDRASPGKEM